MTTRKVNIVKSADWPTILLYLALTFMGWLNIYAAVYNQEHQSIFDFSQLYGKQLLWIGFALLIGFIIFIVESKTYHFFSYIIYGIVILLLISILYVARETHGAKAWFEIGSMKFQPAEFGKLATALALARFLSSFNIKIHKSQNLFILLLIIFTPAALIVLQNDVGSAIVYVTFVFVLFREGLTPWVLILGILTLILFFASLLVVPIKVLLSIIAVTLLFYRSASKESKNVLLAAGIISALAGIFWAVNYYFDLKISLYFIILSSVFAASIYFIYHAFKKNERVIFLLLALFIGSVMFSFSVDYVFHNVLQKHQRNRINVLLNKNVDEKNAGYNVAQSKIAIGSGGLYGKGYLKGTQTKFDFVPEQHTDFIFCTVGEEWGFIGSVVIVALFVALLLRLIFLAERQRSTFGRVYGYSVASILFFHFAVNIGMTIGLAPVIGIPLPFFSYGGSSLWSFTILLFIFIRLDASRLELF